MEEISDYASVVTDFVSIATTLTPTGWPTLAPNSNSTSFPTGFPTSMPSTGPTPFKMFFNEDSQLMLGTSIGSCLGALSIMIIYAVNPDLRKKTYIQILFWSSLSDFLGAVATALGYLEDGTEICVAQAPAIVDTQLAIVDGEVEPYPLEDYVTYLTLALPLSQGFLTAVVFFATTPVLRQKTVHAFRTSVAILGKES
eukprot:gene46327-61952_t